MDQTAPSPIRLRYDLISEDLPDAPVDRVHGKRAVRRKQILDLVRRQGPLSRIEVASKLGHNFRTITEFVDELVQGGLLIEDRKENAPRAAGVRNRNPIGRPPIPLSINTRAACAIGIELARHRIICQSMDLGGNVLSRLRGELPPDDREDFITIFESHVHRFLELHDLPMPPVAGVGITFADIFFHRENGEEVLNPLHQAVVNSITRIIGVQPIVDADTAMLALGELWFDHDAAQKTLAVVYLCEGAGAEIVESGQIWRGSEKRACDLGHLQLGEEGVPCYCGRMACLENIASSAGLQRLALARGLAKEGQPISVDELAQMARDGFKPARELWQLFGKTLGKGLDVLCVIANPETIVIYGPVAEHADLFLEEAIAQVDQGALPRYRRAVKFEVSPVHEDAVCAGACACVLRRVFGATQDFLESVV